jgi:hypothetical protein
MVTISEHNDTWGLKVSVNMTPEDLLALKYSLIFGGSDTTILDKILEVIRKYYDETE